MGMFFGVLMGFLVQANAGTLEFDSSVNPNLRAQVEGDLQFVSGVQGSQTSPLHAEIFGPVSGQGYASWFTHRVFYLGFSDCGGSSGAVACVTSKDRNKIWVTRNYTEIDHPEVSRIMTLFHEARHTETDHRNWPHSRCPLFFRERSIWTGKSLRFHFACDATEYGSYASASILLNNLSRYCVSCSEKIKNDAKIYSSDQIKRVTRNRAFSRLRRDFQE